jgi:hypothetical protein
LINLDADLRVREAGSVIESEIRRIIKQIGALYQTATTHSPSVMPLHKIKRKLLS